MIYYIFDNESEALLAEQQIIENIKNWVLFHVPDALSPDGKKLRGRNAATGELVDIYTERWAVPLQTTDNKWVFPKPTIEKTTPIPVEVFIANIVANEIESNSVVLLTNEIEL